MAHLTYLIREGALVCKDDLGYKKGKRMEQQTWVSRKGTLVCTPGLGYKRENEWHNKPR